jgi:peptidoglycan/LPS O-acetylase OafA/YrhL
VPDAPPASRPRGRLGYLPGLDGIRALAVLAIIGFHTGFAWLPGGYYSVDAFFVLSGFLITSLLVVEWQQTSTIRLSAFWARRARRLLPALFVMLTLVGILSAILPGELASPHLRSDTLATLFYVANWHFIISHANYFFATSQPSPLLHTWTLAIEEQFYLVWPIVVFSVLHLGRPARRVGNAPVTGQQRPATGAIFVSKVGKAADGASPRRRLVLLLLVSLGGAAASSVWMALQWHPGGDPTRMYYGTDTRAQSLLVGAALAIALALHDPSRTRAGRRALAGFALAGAVGTAALWTRVDQSSAIAFRGGFFLAALGTAGVVAGTSRLERNPVSRLLALPPLTYLGKISYGVYLWYWPTLLVVDHATTGTSGYALFAARLAVVVSIASVSYHFLELPIRRGAIPAMRALVAAPLAASIAAATVFVATGISAAPAGASISALASATSGGNLVDRPLATRQQGQGTSTTSADAPSPERILLVGDSMAGSLGVGFGRVAASDGAVVENEGDPGCSAGMDGDFKVLWYTVPPGSPCEAGSPGHLMDVWRAEVDRFDPDVSVYFARGDLMDQSVGGHWEHVDQPAYDAYLRARLEETVTTLSRRGGHVVLLTDPLFNSGEQPDGSRWPEDDPARVKTYNEILEAVARSNPSEVTVLRVGALLSPGKQFDAKVGGVDVRCSDGVHITVAGGDFTGAWLLPRLETLGAAHHLEDPLPPAGSRLPQGPSVPPWFAKLPCRT